MTNQEKQFFVYILRCKDGSLYTGYTVDLDKRIALHQAGKASKYTRSRLPLKMVYHEVFDSKNEAMSREALIKQLSKSKKEKLVQDFSLTSKKNQPGRR